MFARHLPQAKAFKSCWEMNVMQVLNIESVADHADQEVELSENSAYYMQKLPSGKYGAEKLIFNINSIKKIR